MKIISKVTGKNQVTIPAAVARKLGIRPGMQVEWVLNDNNSVTLRPVLPREERVRRLESKW